MSALQRAIARFCLGVALAASSPVLAKGNESAELPLSEGVVGLLAELREREADLHKKERELTERERSIGQLESQVDLRVAELDAMRKAIEKRIEEWTAKNGDRIARLSKVYSEMPANKAAPLLQELDRDLSAEILARMKQKKSAAILAVMPRSEALRLSRRLARPFADALGKGR